MHFASGDENPPQIPSGARGPYSGGIQYCLLNHDVVVRFPLLPSSSIWSSKESL